MGYGKSIHLFASGTKPFFVMCTHHHYQRTTGYAPVVCSNYAQVINSIKYATR